MDCRACVKHYIDHAPGCKRPGVFFFFGNNVARGELVVVFTSAMKTSPRGELVVVETTINFASGDVLKGYYGYRSKSCHAGLLVYIRQYYVVCVLLI